MNVSLQSMSWSPLAFWESPPPPVMKKRYAPILAESEFDAVTSASTTTTNFSDSASYPLRTMSHLDMRNCARRTSKHTSGTLRSSGSRRRRIWLSEGRASCAMVLMPTLDSAARTSSAGTGRTSNFNQSDVEYRRWQKAHYVERGRNPSISTTSELVLSAATNLCN